MIIRCNYITDSPSTSFVPRKLLEVNLPEKKWLRVNFGMYPPVELLKYGGVSHPGIDGQYIELNINSYTVDLKIGDLLSIEKYDMIIREIN